MAPRSVVLRSQGGDHYPADVAPVKGDRGKRGTPRKRVGKIGRALSSDLSLDSAHPGRFNVGNPAMMRGVVMWAENRTEDDAMGFTGVKVFSATKAKEREALGDFVTMWLRNNPNLEITGKTVDSLQRLDLPAGVDVEIKQV